MSVLTPRLSRDSLFELAQARYPDWYCDESVDEDTVEARLASFLQRVRVVRVHSSSDLRKQYVGHSAPHATTCVDYTTMYVG